MFINKPVPLDKRGNSGKKIHRRVITEVEEMPVQMPLQREFKKTDRITTKPKFIDVYSKYVAKNNNEPRRPYKLADNKPFTSDKHLKTEAD